MTSNQNFPNSSKYLLDNSIRVRKESNGAIIYTKHHSGYFVNTLGFEIINNLKEPKTIDEISALLKKGKIVIEKYIEKLLTLGIINVKEP